MEQEGAITAMAAQGTTPPTVQPVDPSQIMRQFVRAATIRAVRTMAQTAASLMSAKALISDVNWLALISATVMSGILSILTSVYTGLPETDAGQQNIAKIAQGVK